MITTTFLTLLLLTNSAQRTTTNPLLLASGLCSPPLGRGTKRVREEMEEEDHETLLKEQMSTLSSSYYYPLQPDRFHSAYEVAARLDPVHFASYFRIDPTDIHDFMAHLKIPDTITTPDRHKCDGGLAFLMLLFKMTAPRPYRPDAEFFFGQDQTRICK